MVIFSPRALCSSRVVRVMSGMVAAPFGDPRRRGGMAVMQGFTRVVVMEPDGAGCCPVDTAGAGRPEDGRRAIVNQRRIPQPKGIRQRDADACGNGELAGVCC